ncbi:porin [Alphaproteobacteria bacterium]|nr:porin [Alphaproteobacteria bacterium]
MKNFLITLSTLVAFSLSGVAFADGHSAKVSGFMQRILGVGSDVDGGVSEQFTRFVIGADTTIDNGWTVGGSMSIQTAAMTGGIYAPSTNHMYIQTDMMTINIGNTVGPVSGSVPAVNAMVPGGGVDAGYQFIFDGGLLANWGVPFREAYYADNAAKIDVDFPTMNGFTIGVSYTPSQEFNASIQARVQAETTLVHGETIEVGIKYDGEMDGMSYTVGAGIVSGNSSTENAGTATQVQNNDLSAVSVGLTVTMGNMTVGVHGYDNGDSFGASTDADKAKNSGYNTAITWAMGNMTVGVGYSHQEGARGTSVQAWAATFVGIDRPNAAAGNVREDSITMLGIGYDMGGGVNTFVQLSNNDHSDGDHATTEVDPQVLFAGISLGF